MPRTPDDILDELLILQAQAGEPAALDRIVSRWHGRLARHAWHLTRSDDGASDVMQECWLAIVRGLPRLRDPARFKSWAFAIVTNKAADWVHHRARSRRAKESLQTSEPNDAQGDTVHEAATDGERITRLRKALGELSADHRTVLNMHYTEQMSVGDIAAAIDVPPGTVKSRLHHARQHLQAILERDTP